MSGESALYTGQVMHQRLRPARHRLRYGVFSMLIDLDELPALLARLKLFSLNRFNLFSLHEHDFGSGSGLGLGGLRGYVMEQLRSAGIDGTCKIQLLTMPRILGYAFNPLNVYYCYAEHSQLQAVLYEVNNTFGERHSYLIEVDVSERDGGLVTQRCTKEFHVSPFMTLDMNYQFRLMPPRPDRASMSIAITASDAQGAVLIARLESVRRVLTDTALVKAFFTHPLLTLKVVAGIHWEALRLLAKGVRLHARPPAPIHPITVVKPLDS